MSIVVDHAKELAELIKKYINQELYQRIVDLRDDIFNLSEKNLQLRKRIKELEREEDIDRELIRDENAYMLKHNDGSELRYHGLC